MGHSSEDIDREFPARIINMSEAKSTEKVCVELLADALRSPIENSRQSYYILERLALCFVSVARDVRNLTVEVYGNGTPGGLKAEMRELKANINELKEMIVADRKSIDTKADAKDDSDWFKMVVEWFVDKVLPHFVTATITVIALTLYWAIQNGALNTP